MINNSEKIRFLFFQLIFLGAPALFAHQGSTTDQMNPYLWERMGPWLGQFHPIFLHFPIALLFMSVIADLLYILKKEHQYKFTVKFLLSAAALFSIPTVTTGLFFEMMMHFSEREEVLIWWHEVFGFTTASLAILSAFLLNYFPNFNYYRVFLYTSLFAALLTAYIGGEITFGALKIVP